MHLAIQDVAVVSIVSLVVIVVLMIYLGKGHVIEGIVPYGPKGMYTTVPQHMRPNSWYNMSMPIKDEYNVPIVVMKLYYLKSCIQKGPTEHPLVRVFANAQDELESNNHAAINKNIKFKMLDADKYPCELPGVIYPAIVKTGRTGVTREYTGSSDIGEFIDFILNEDNVSTEGCGGCGDFTKRYAPEVGYLGSQELQTTLYDPGTGRRAYNDLFKHMNYGNVDLWKYDPKKDVIPSEKINTKLSRAEAFLHVPRDSVSDQVLIGDSAYDVSGVPELHRYSQTYGTPFDTTKYQF